MRLSPRTPAALPGARRLRACRAGALALAALLALSGCRDGRPATAATQTGGKSRFTDVAEAAGLHYEWSIPGKRPLNILQTIGNGCGLFDYDGDGNLDVLLVGPKPALFRGDGAGHFEEATRESGLAEVTGHFLGCSVGDYDGDGWRDLYLTGFRSGALLRNLQGRRFQEVSKASGVPPQPWSTSALFLEAEPGAGRLDLYVGNYAVFGPEVKPQLCLEKGIQTSCGPRHYTPLKGTLFRNLGGGRFQDVTHAAGADKTVGRALGVAAADYAGIGRPAIAVANDEMPGDLLRPVSGKGPIRFTNAGTLSGTSFDRDGNVHGGMGIDWGDYDNDGRLDLFVATFQKESKSLYHNEGDGIFTDMGIPTGIGMAAAPYVTFGAKFFDYDNDGWLDVVLANGHVQDNIAKIDPSTTYRQGSQLFRNPGGTRIFFEDVSQAMGPDLTRPIVGRGLATGDFDNDGRVDLLIVDSEGKPLLLHNEVARPGHWLGVGLQGTRSNRDGYGAVLTARIGGRTLVRQCQSAGSYLSASDPRVHFGLGAAARVDSLSIRWPSGRIDTLSDLPADRYIAVKEGSGSAP